jgi:hypothetical protein
LRLLEDRLEDGLAVADGDLEVDRFAVLFAELGARVADRLGDALVGDGSGRLVLSTLCVDVLLVERSDPLVR